jgi:hypothetical protein
VQEAYRSKIRVICHSLKMAPLTGVDPTKTIGLSSRIKALPSAEKIASMDHGGLVALSGRVEKLIFDIDNSKNSRTLDYAIRHRIDKGIPPRLAPILAKKANWFERSTTG